MTQESIFDGCVSFGSDPTGKTDRSIATLDRVLENHPIDRACVFCWDGVQMDVRRGNDRAIELGRNNPRYRPVAVLDPRHTDGGAREVERCEQQGVRLYRLFPDCHGYPWRYEPLKEIWEILHGTQNVLLVPGVRYGDVTDFVEAVEKYSFKRILIGCHYFFYTEFLSVLKRDPLSLMMTVAVNYPNAYETLTQQIGAARVCFGSNAPIYAIDAGLDVLKNAEIWKEERQRILSGTLLELLDEKP